MGKAAMLNVVVEGKSQRNFVVDFVFDSHPDVFAKSKVAFHFGP